MDLAIACEPICAALPRHEWKLASQIRRAANSVHASIAEGNGSFSTSDYLRHLGIANKSLRELQSHLHFVGRRYGERRITQVLELSNQAAMLLMGLVKSLRKKREQE